jgi:hypothetical protein
MLHDNGLHDDGREDDLLCRQDDAKLAGPGVEIFPAGESVLDLKF